jgi:N-acyl-D-aspartate/D-glutamate deacylase
MSYDLVIRNGTVVDGSGQPGYLADVGIVGDRITTIGKIRESAHRVLDAEGRVVTPGFIDGHTHMDAQVMWDPLGTSSCWHGVTTVVMGNCGFTLAPARPAERALVVRNLERAEDISPVAMAAGLEWSWETFAEYLDVVDRVPKGINYSAYLGHSALRTWAMGERAFEEQANGDDLEKMVGELASALQAGAIGFSTSRSMAHMTADGRPVASRQAGWDEVCRLVGLLGEHKSRVFALTPGNAVDEPDVRRRTMQELSALAVKTGVSITFGVGAVAPGCYDTLDLIDATAAAGGTIFGQTSSRGFNSILSFKTHLPFDVLPEWKEVRERPLPEQKHLLQDPLVRERLIHAAHHGNYGHASGAEPRRPDYDLMRLMDQPIPPNPSVAEEAKRRGVDPVELMIDLAIESNFEQFFLQPLVLLSIVDALALMKHPRTVMTFSDSGAHVSQIIDASIHTHLLAYWVRQRQDFTLEEAVRMITAVPAAAWGFSGRGRLEEGFVADVNVFDPDEVGPGWPTVVNDLPAGETRLEQKATGFVATVVAGQVSLLDGEPTGALPGRLLRAE